MNWSELAPYFSPDTGQRFVLFSAAHLLTLIALFAIVLLVWLFRRPLRHPRVNRWFRYSLAWLAIVSELALNLWLVATDEWTLAYSLPLHLCSISILLSIIMLFTRHKGIFEFTYIAGLGGAMQALVTPNLGGYPFPHFINVQFFISHGIIVIACCYMIFVEKVRPQLSSVWRSLLILNVYMVIIAGINWLTGGNYLYIARKPPGASLLDLLGPWPWYILSLEVVAVATFLLLYLPFGTLGWLERRRTRK